VALSTPFLAALMAASSTAELHISTPSTWLALALTAVQMPMLPAHAHTHTHTGTCAQYPRHDLPRGNVHVGTS
jgi:hypothetical protein